MKNLIFLLLFLGISSLVFGQKNKDVNNISSFTKDFEKHEGYFDFYWDAKAGKVWLLIDKLNKEFLYVNSLTGGVGSNDIGLDRNQLGDTRVVKFIRSGHKVLMLQPNLDYRAVSDNIEEKKSVEEAFAQSVLGGFTVEAEAGNKVLVDITSFLMRDAHGVSNRLRANQQGSYSIDPQRSFINMERSKNFPKNTELDALLTFSGSAEGQYIRSVTPSNNSITVKMHHSFVELPDGNYKPRKFDPRSGYYNFSYFDYATPIDQPLTKRFITRHRLEKKNPSAAISEAVEPIIYYLDRGTPEPVRSALLDGARWWNQAFEAAGYKNAFQVKILPEDADPMDVRYNVINWVHRSTRGWSYGSSVTDPRTGEIIKGHVLLGSLRVRQDFLIAQGLAEAYKNENEADPRLQEMALARLRQLSAHEVGHTIGLAHNFAASTNNRASVMDYPHPLINMLGDGEVDFSKAYDDKIGEWDKRTVLYGYQDFPEGTNEDEELNKILEENQKMGLKYISDKDARPMGGAHLTGHLWDNGENAADELDRLIRLRQKAMEKFSIHNIPSGEPMATLEKVFVPIYLSHRYQVDATSKIIGGVDYNYAIKGDGQTSNSMVDDQMQRKALKALLTTLEPTFLGIPEHIIAMIPPQPIGYARDREMFKTHTGGTFDPLAAAETSANFTLQFLLHPHRLSRLIEQSARTKGRLSAMELIDDLLKATKYQQKQSAYHKEINRTVNKLLVLHLLQLAGDKSINQQVSALALAKINELEASLLMKINNQKLKQKQNAHNQYLVQQIAQFRANPEKYQVPKSLKMPDGSPIGCTH